MHNTLTMRSITFYQQCANIERNSRVRRHHHASWPRSQAPGNEATCKLAVEIKKYAKLLLRFAKIIEYVPARRDYILLYVALPWIYVK